MQTDIIFCPKCGCKLEINGARLVCKKGHSYDIAKEGYVNLLPPSKKGDVPGDNKEMVRARRSFLMLDKYLPLRNEIVNTAASYSPSVLCDIGCGEGYYTSRLSDVAKKAFGFDISKFALQYAARSDKKTSYFAANLHSLPVEDSVADVLCCCFCAVDEKEFARVLKSKGKFILVSPGKRHLFSLKEFLYAEPYENDTQDNAYGNFELIGRKELKYGFSLDKAEDIWNLFTMTPYFWKTPKESEERLRKLERLSVSAEFIIRVYEKN